jgi:hypothetical protein
MSEPSPKPTITNLAPAMLTARIVKVTIPLDPHEIARLVAVEGQARAVLRLGMPATTLRKAITTIRDNGPENCIALVQGKLEGAKIVEAELVAQVRAPKPAGHC